MLNFLYKPGEFYIVADKVAFSVLRQITIYLMIFGLLYALIFSPNDYQQGFTVKIMYIHVPSAWLSMFIYAIDDLVLHLCSCI